MQIPLEFFWYIEKSSPNIILGTLIKSLGLNIFLAASNAILVTSGSLITAGWWEMSYSTVAVAPYATAVPYAILLLNFVYALL